MWNLSDNVRSNENVVVIECGHGSNLDFEYVVILRSDNPEIRYFCCTNCYRLVFARMIEDLRTVTMKIK